MTQIGIIRCEKNEERCPLTNCIKCLDNTAEGFSDYEEAKLTGVFTCRCPGDNAALLGKILKSKGAEAIHFCTCAFSKKQENRWTLGDGFCDHLDEIMKTVAEATQIPCVKGTAHLPAGYQAEKV